MAFNRHDRERIERREQQRTARLLARLATPERVAALVALPAQLDLLVSRIFEAHPDLEALDHDLDDWYGDSMRSLVDD